MSTLKQSFATAVGIEEDLCKTESTKLSDKKEIKRKRKILMI